MFSLILPTYNEAENLPALLPKIEDALSSVEHEIIIVDDDSPDETWKVAEGLGARVIRRIGRRGLSSAVIEGFEEAKGDVLAVMDADGQHDTGLLPRLHQAVKDGASVAIGSRYVEGGGVDGLNAVRLRGSRIATWLALRFCRMRVQDPLTGFFAIDRTVFEHVRPRLRPQGFKILLEILARVPKGTTVQELPLQFGARLHGESKLTATVQLQFLLHLTQLLLERSAMFVFMVACIVCLILYLPLAWSLQPLYLDADVRGQAQEALEQTADVQGWLLSDVLLTDVAEDHISILHRSHLRGEDPVHCYHIDLRSFDLTPCDSL